MLLTEFSAGIVDIGDHLMKTQIHSRNEEVIDWSVMGPIYKDQCEALKNVVLELEKRLTNNKEEKVND